MAVVPLLFTWDYHMPVLIGYVAIQNKMFKVEEKKKTQERKDDPSWIRFLIWVLVFLLILFPQLTPHVVSQSPLLFWQMPYWGLYHWPCVRMEFEMGSLYSNNVSAWNLKLGLFTYPPQPLSAELPLLPLFSCILPWFSCVQSIS